MTVRASIRQVLRLASVRLDGRDVDCLAADLWREPGRVERWGATLDLPLGIRMWWGEVDLEAETLDGSVVRGRASVQRLVRTDHHLRLALRGVGPVHGLT